MSDLHLTDHPAGHPGLEDELVAFLDDLVRRSSQLPGCRTVELVLLGDIVDVLKSSRWAENPGIRPWGLHDTALGNLVLEITYAVLDRFPNFVRKLRELKQGTRREYRIRYFIGNHDFLLNSPAAARARALLTEQLHLQDDPGEPFLEADIWPEYRVVAAHGHEFDPWNSVQDRVWPFGDATVVELLQGFLSKAAERLALSEDDAFLRRLTEIYYVVPHTLAPLWTLAALEQPGTTPEHYDTVTQAWAKSIKTLFRTAYTRRNLRTYRKMKGFRCRERVLKVASKLDPLAVANALRKLLAAEQDHISYERRVRLLLACEPSCKYVVIGHTHLPGIWPLEPARDTREARVYINTGAWGQVHRPVLFDNVRYQHFSSEFASSWVVFFHPEEQKHTNNEYEFHPTWAG